MVLMEKVKHEKLITLVADLDDTLSELNWYNAKIYPDPKSTEAIELERAYVTIREGKEIIEDFLDSEE
jgi:hypothetical protein